MCVGNIGSSRLAKRAGLFNSRDGHFCRASRESAVSSTTLSCSLANGRRDARLLRPFGRNHKNLHTFNAVPPNDCHLLAQTKWNLSANATCVSQLAGCAIRLNSLASSGCATRRKLFRMATKRQSVHSASQSVSQPSCLTGRKWSREQGAQPTT
jgi:hypothetical protein